MREQYVGHSATDEEKRLRAENAKAREILGRIARAAPDRDREMSARMAREFQGAGGSVFISHATMRDLHDWLAK